MGAADLKGQNVDTTFFQRREFCFTLDGDIFVRYQSFKVCSHSARFFCVGSASLAPSFLLPARITVASFALEPHLFKKLAITQATMQLEMDSRLLLQLCC